MNIQHSLTRTKRQSRNCANYHFHRYALEYLRARSDVNTIKDLFRGGSPDCRNLVRNFIKGKTVSSALDGLERYVKGHPCHRSYHRSSLDQTMGAMSDMKAMVDFQRCASPRNPPPPGVRALPNVNWDAVKKGLIVTGVVAGTAAVVAATGGAAAAAVPALAVG